MQPPAMLITSSALRLDQVGVDRQRAEVVDEHREARPRALRSRWLTSVVLPAPR